MITLCTNFKRNRPTCRPWSLRQKLLSAYEVKNECALFKRLFKVKKNGAFCFGISFFVKKYSRFCIMQMKKGMTPESRIYPEILEQCFSNLAPEMYSTKETELHLLYCYHVTMATVLAPVPSVENQI